MVDFCPRAHCKLSPASVDPNAPEDADLHLFERQNKNSGRAEKRKDTISPSDSARTSPSTSVAARADRRVLKKLSGFCAGFRHPDNYL
jgi:hypothetical protein